MGYKEKRTVLELVYGVSFISLYCFYAYGKFSSGQIISDDLKSWAFIMVSFIGIGIVAMILLQIFFHIYLAISVAIRERSSDEKMINKTIESNMKEDEMDQLIGLKSSKVGFICAGTGFLAGLVSLILNAPAAVMINMVFISFCLGSLAEGFFSLYLYRNGVKNG